MRNWSRSAAHLTMTKICKFCQEAFARTRKNRNNVHCDECVKTRAYNRKYSLAEIRHPQTRRNFLIDKRGHTCQICNNSEWCGKPIPLETDHIDGNHNNNEESNLRLICPNCHAQTPNYKARNKGNGRHYRRQRYAEGKSY